MRGEAQRRLEALGGRVRQLRGERGWTLRRLAEASGVSERFLSDLEAGRGNISVARLWEVAVALGSQPGALLAEVEAPEADARRRVIALLGLRGAGKSTIGPKLASRLRLPFFELDGLVEAEAGISVAEIFALHGEEYYRRLELAVAERFLERQAGAVLATGGGLVTSEPAMRLLDRRCVTVWLRADAGDHWERVVRQGDSRPMRGNPRAMSELRSLLARREPLYARARLQIDTSRLGVKGSVDALIQALGRSEEPGRWRPAPS